MPNKARPAVDQYAVIGNPINHSKSPFLHTVFAAQSNQAMSYRAILAPTDQFANTLKRFIDDGGRGANITLPFKIDVYDLCDELTPRAEAAGAVNTLSFDQDRIVGDNTDGCGLVRDITQNARVVLENKRILLIGAGGAARGVVMPLLECHPAELTIANRSSEKAHQLANEFKRYGKIRYSELTALNTQFDVIINATSSSINAQRPDIPDVVFKPGALAYDMMYGPTPTLFMQHATKHRAKARNGWGMLVEQAAEAFFIWRGVRPDTSELLSREHSSMN
jgi:shikimate dehydrogenase